MPPFKSEKQRRYLHAKEPEIAKKWEKEKYSEGGIPDDLKREARNAALKKYKPKKRY